LQCTIGKRVAQFLWKGSAMSVSLKNNSKDETRIGEYAAKQPLSGINIVSKANVKGIIGSAFVRMEESKKAV
jgi:hypothetical protein